MKRITLLTQLFFILFIYNINAQPTNGLIARFPMNQEIEDIQGSHIVNIIGEAPTPAIDRYGNQACALSFNATGYGLIENGIDFSPAFNYSKSISLWISFNLSTICVLSHL